MAASVLHFSRRTTLALLMAATLSRGYNGVSSFSSPLQFKTTQLSHDHTRPRPNMNHPLSYRPYGARVRQQSSLPAEPTGEERGPIRPEWACDWMPTWLITMRPAVQLLVGLVIYIFHLKVLTQHMIPFPIQLIPNDRGQFQSIGLDSVAGILSLLFGMCLQRTTRNKPTPAVPPLWRGPTKREAPWRLPKRLLNTVRMKRIDTNGIMGKGKMLLNQRKRKNSIPKNDSPTANRKRKLKMSKAAREVPGPKITSIFALLLLVRTYLFSGLFGVVWEDALYAAAGVGFSMTKAMHRSLCVLLGHLTWIGLGGLILKLVPRPQPFFGGGYTNDLDGYDDVKPTKKLTRYKWFTSKWNTYWLWWVVGGYFVSSWLYNVSDFINQSVLPPVLFEEPAEGVVSQLVNPENNDLSASLVGFIAPCITAPWWEEVLYRGFLLPAMCLHLPYWMAVLGSGIVFSVHHQSLLSAIPLAFLGWIWAAVYTKSGNLLVTILIHAMWNSRVFVGSWLGL